ncbi:glutaredoxin family protein [Pseudomonadota bacterium]
MTPLKQPPIPNPLIFYGAPWCSDCIRAKSLLDEKKVHYDYVNIDENTDAAKQVIKINGGNRSIPTIIFPNGKILTEPSNQELSDELTNLT